MSFSRGVDRRHRKSRDEMLDRCFGGWTVGDKRDRDKLFSFYHDNPIFHCTSRSERSTFAYLPRQQPPSDGLSLLTTYIGRRCEACQARRIKCAISETLFDYNMATQAWSVRGRVRAPTVPPLNTVVRPPDYENGLTVPPLEPAAQVTTHTRAEACAEPSANRVGEESLLDEEGRRDIYVEGNLRPDHFHNHGRITYSNVSPSDLDAIHAGIPVFKPTLRLFNDLFTFIRHMKPWGELYGAVKVIPPARWCAQAIPFDPPKGLDIIRYYSQRPSRVPKKNDWYKVMYTAEDSSTSNAEEPAFPPVAWDDWVAEDVYPAESFKSLSPEDRQRIESQVLLQQAARTASRYATSLNGSVFPPTLQDPGVRWHMNYLSNPLQALQRCEGINTSFIYLGSYGSSFEWHAEDLLSYSMNWVQWGADKLWYVVAPGDLEAWEAEVRNDLVSSYTAKKYKNTCHNFLRHKDLSIHKGVIESMGYKTNAVFQHAGEMIITFPRGVHSGFNLGTNLAEAQNFCTPDWLEETFPSCKRAYQCPEACALDLYSLDLEPLELLRERLRLGESWEQICGGMVMQETTNARAMWQ